MLVDNHVAILEAKTQFQSLRNEKPVISDKSLAQMVCEGLVTRASNTDMSEIPTHRKPQCLRYEHYSFELCTNDLGSVVIIHATQHYMCFLHLEISYEYMETFDGPTPTHMLYVSSTPWFDLSQKGGRKNVLANWCGIMYRAISE